MTATKTHDPATGTYSITVTGTGFPNIAADISFTIDGTLQTITSATTTSFTATVSGLQSANPTVKLRFPDGTPTGHSAVENLVFSTKFNSVSPSTITTGGATLILTVNGIGPATTETLSLKDETQTPAASICSSISIIDSETVECVTTITASVLDPKLFVGTSKFNCAGSCAITVDEANLPDVSTITASGTTITFSGTDLDQSATHDISAKLGGVLGTSLNIGAGTV